MGLQWVLQVPKMRIHPYGLGSAFPKMHDNMLSFCSLLFTKLDLQLPLLLSSNDHTGFTISYHTTPQRTSPYHIIPCHKKPNHAILFHPIPCPAIIYHIPFSCSDISDPAEVGRGEGCHGGIGGVSSGEGWEVGTARRQDRHPATAGTVNNKSALSSFFSISAYFWSRPLLNRYWACLIVPRRYCKTNMSDCTKVLLFICYYLIVPRLA